MQFFHHNFLSVIFFYSKALIDNTDSKSWVQIVVKLSMEVDLKILNQQ